MWQLPARKQKGGGMDCVHYFSPFNRVGGKGREEGRGRRQEKGGDVPPVHAHWGSNLSQVGEPKHPRNAIRREASIIRGGGGLFNG
eukprot:scaffold19766_cov122-Isochrysis_galbana.AAC.1